MLPYPILQPKNWFRVAFVNAFGTIIGVMGVVYFVQLKGTDYIKDLNPKIFESSTWEKTSDVMKNYGAAGTVMASAMPVVLHPIILFGMLAGMDNTVLIITIFLGRVIKYSIMANRALTAPKMLKVSDSSTRMNTCNSWQLVWERLSHHPSLSFDLPRFPW